MAVFELCSFRTTRIRAVEKRHTQVDGRLGAFSSLQVVHPKRRQKGAPVQSRFGFLGAPLCDPFLGLTVLKREAEGNM